MLGAAHDLAGALHHLRLLGFSCLPPFLSLFSPWGGSRDAGVAPDRG